MSGGATRVGATAILALMIAGCATLGGNVKGDFSCRAPEGSCAPAGYWIVRPPHTEKDE